MTEIRFNKHGLQQPESDHGYIFAMTLADPSLIRAYSASLIESIFGRRLSLQNQ